MAEVTIDAAGEVVGPVRVKKAILALTGTMTAGGIVVEYQLSGSETWYPGDYVSIAKLQQVPNQAGNGYGYVTEVSIPEGVTMRGRASAAFAGSLTANLIPVNT